MQFRISLPYSRLIMMLFALGLIAAAFALFWISYLDSKSIAEHEISRTANSQAAITRLVIDQYFNQLENQLRKIAADPDLRAAIEREDMAAASQIAEQATLGLNSAVLDILLIDLPGKPAWVNTSLGLVDIRKQIPAEARNALPPDIWIVYTNYESDPKFLTAAISLPILYPGTGVAAGKIIGGISITDSFVLPGLLADTLKIFSLGLFHDNEMVAGLGDIATDTLPDIWPKEPDKMNSILRGDTLYVATPVQQDLSGHILSAVIKLPVDTLQKVEDTYLQLFLPFLGYTLILTAMIAWLIHRITNAGLGRLLAYTNTLSRDQTPAAPEPGLIREFNQLATNFQQAFEVTRDRDAQFKELIDGSMHGVFVHANHRVLYINPVFLEMLGYPSDNTKAFVGTSILSFYEPDEHERLQDYYRLREHGQAPRSYEVKGRHKDGHTVWFENHVQIIEWDGAPAYYVTATSIKDRKLRKQNAQHNNNGSGTP